MKGAGRIHSAGPWTTELEARYAAEAAQFGWYGRYKEFVDRFETGMAAYVGVRHGHATPHGTHALHLALAALGIGPGDEVIVPEITWVASANAVLYLGAKVVVVDVEASTWCIDPDAVERAITPATRAIMPVHAYGNPCDMDRLGDIASKHGLFVVEDACPAVGSTYHGRMCGSFGDAAAHSYQGSKLLVTGEGGMMLTNGDALSERAAKLASQGRDDAEGTFWCSELGFQYSMSNVAAAVGLAQLERVEELVAAKRRIFQWYADRLADVPGVTMIWERDGCRSNYSYPSCAFSEDLPATRDDVRRALSGAGIDTRPVFPRISRFPHLTDADTPVAARVERTGLNLPGPYNLTEADADRVVAVVRATLSRRG